MNRLCRGLIPLTVAAAAVGASAVRADEADYDNRFYVAPMGSFTLADNDRGTNDGFGGTLAIGKRISKDLELELLGNFTSYDTRQGDFSTPQPNSARAYSAGAGANIYLLPSAAWYARGLFVHADLMRGKVDGQPGPVNRYTTTLFDAGLGWDLPLPITLFGLIPPGMILRGEALYHYDGTGQSSIGTDVGGTGQDHNSFNEVQFNLGLHIPIGRGPQPPPASQPDSAPSVVPVEQPSEAPAAPADGAVAPPPPAAAPPDNASAPAPADGTPAPPSTGSAPQQ